MFMVFEISRPIVWKPYVYRSELTKLRLVWLCFALSFHKIRFDELMDLAAAGIAVWVGK